jgi:hypothetical protein
VQISLYPQRPNYKIFRKIAEKAVRSLVRRQIVVVVQTIHEGAEVVER